MRALRAQLAAAERVVDAARNCSTQLPDRWTQLDEALAAYDAATVLRDPPPGAE